MNTHAYISRKINELLAKRSYIRHISSEQIASAIDAERFWPTEDFDALEMCDAVILCVPTPLNRNREPDMSYIAGCAKTLAPRLRRNQLVVLESTTWPGTTEEFLRPALESESLVAGRDFYLAFSPEREDPGNKKFQTVQIPKIIGGYTQESTEVACALYAAVMDRVVPVSSTRVAEMTKLLENIFRSVNIALVNELKVLCHAMDINIWEVIDAAATKPFGFMPFYPGPGLGGHCIPIDPFYLTWKAREFEQPTRFIELAGQINVAMHHYVIERLIQGLNEHGKSVKGSTIWVLGVAYKPDIDDMRESPALAIMTMLEHLGARVRYHDPYVPELAPTPEHALRYKSTPLESDGIKGADACVIVTDHSCIDYGQVCDLFPLVVDCRNATRHVKRGREKIVSA